MKTNNNICGGCRYHAPQHNEYGQIIDWWCENIDSDYCAMSTDYDDSCDEFEERGTFHENDIQR